MHIIIVGAGAIGTCVAYFLSQKAINNDDLSITVIEQTSVACAASGKAGGFLARDWSDDTPLGPIARKSFTLHAELADKLDGKKRYGYRQLDTFSALLQTSEMPTTKKYKANKQQKQKSSAINWIQQDKVRREEQLGTTANTAQVHPGQFTQVLMEAAQKTGRVTLACGVGVESLLYEGEDNVVRGVILKDGREIKADRVVVAMGPWSGQLTMKGRRRTNHLPIDGVRAHSIVFTRADSTAEAVPPQALFTSVADGRQSHEPEVYPRPDGTLYMCSATDTAEPLPPSADGVKVDSEAIEQLRLLRDIILLPAYHGEICARQACYLPISRDGSPLIGAHPTHRHLYLAAGHSCWGILNAPATGLMLAELLLDGVIHCVQDRIAVDSVDPMRLSRGEARKMI